MRISNKMIADRVLHNLSQSTSRFLNLQTMASSGKRISKPSDDPIGITADLQYRSRLNDLGQFSSNLSYSSSWLTYSEQAIGGINDLIIEAKDLAVQMGNDTFDSNARIAGATQAHEIFQKILDYGNSQFQNKYIFSGSRSNRPPILTSENGAEYVGDYQDIMMEIERGSYLNINDHAANFMTKSVITLGENMDLNPGIQSDMWLAELHRGDGVNMGDGQFVINTLNGSFTIDLLPDNVKNIGRLIDTINAAGIPNFEASIAAGGSGLQLRDTSDHLINANTPLAMLNGGMGVSTSPGIFTIYTDQPAPSTASVDLSALPTDNIGEAINAINAALAAAVPPINNVTASIDPDENTLIIEDTSGLGRILTISDTGGGTTARDLGISGEVDGIMQGDDLRPMRIMVEESSAGQTLAHDLGIFGNTEFENLIGEDLNPVLDYYTKVTSLNNNSGYELGIIEIAVGSKKVEIDLREIGNSSSATVHDIIDKINRSGLDVTASINEAQTGIQVVCNDDAKTLRITEADAGRTASALGIFGSSDLLGSMMVLESALERDNVEEIEATLDTFDRALDQLLTNRSGIGSRIVRTENAGTALLNQEILVTNQLSLVEDADMLRVITELTTAEVVYQSALATTARVIQPSLIDFLR